MSFQDDVEDDPIVFTRDHTQIVVSGPEGEIIQTIDMPALALRRSEVDPTWLAAHDAEQREKEQSNGT
jgi:hypothetical protein